MNITRYIPQVSSKMLKQPAMRTHRSIYMCKNISLKLKYEIMQNLILSQTTGSAAIHNTRKTCVPQPHSVPLFKLMHI